jgi:hypothetical protein
VRRVPASRKRAEGPPQDVEEALSRASRHARRAAAEAIATLRALLDAAALAATGEPSEKTRLAGALATGLDELRGWLATDSTSESDGLLAALGEALEVEIRRWEARGRDDAEARAVLRAFLGLRELLWELGVRPPASRDTATAKSPTSRDTPASKSPTSRDTPASKSRARRGSAASRPTARPRAERVERIVVEG